MTKILVIEDVAHLRNDAVEMLRFEGFEVEGVENGRLGVDMAHQFLPDLIICDIMMPELDGYGVLRELRADTKTATIPFIFLTAKTEPADIRTGMVQGADDYLTKPYSFDELLQAIRARLLRNAAYREESTKQLDQLRANITLSLPHELRTPLNTVIGFSDMLLLEANNMEPDQIVEWATYINNAALRLYHLVENYLTYIRLETVARDEVRLANLKQFRTPEPSKVLEFQVAEMAQRAHRQADLQINIEPSQGDLSMAEQDFVKIVGELIDNAFKFSTSGETIKILGKHDGAVYRINITDHGRGFTPEQIAAIGAYIQFERWFYEQQGSGLGLIIAKRMVEIHGGKFQIDSVPKEYTSITFSLAYAKD